MHLNHKLVQAAVALACLNAASAFDHSPIKRRALRVTNHSQKLHKQAAAASASVTAINANGSPLSMTGGSSSSSSSEERSPPPSQIESIFKNAKLLNPFGSRIERETVISSLAAGLAVSLAMIPEAVSFAYVAGVSPLVGLWTTVFLGFFAASFGGRAGICSSASGACAVVVASLCTMHGPAYLSACALMAGALQIFFGGYLGMGKFIRLVVSTCIVHLSFHHRA